MNKDVTARRASPYGDTDVIDARAPRFNQAVIGTLALVAALFQAPWLFGLLALQLLGGVTFGRRYCLPCLFYFEVVQPRAGEGPLEDSRPPRFANMVGIAFLASATVASYAGAAVLGTALGAIVAALALLAATTGFCMGCEFYKLSAKLRGISPRHFNHIDPADVDLSAISNGQRAIVEFTHPLCSECGEWEQRLRSAGNPLVTVDVSVQPELAHKYGVAYVPTVVAVAGDGTVLERLAP